MSGRTPFAHLLPRFLPDGLPDRLAAGAGVVERREVTALFVRFHGLRAAAGRLPAAEVAALGSRVLAICAEAASRHRGTLDKFFDDTALLVFGAPRALADEQAHAVAAALEIVEAAAGLPGLEPPACALQRGLAVAGVLGGGGRAAWTVIGDAVNTAHRLLEEAPPGEVVAGCGVASALGGGELRIEELPPLPVKGKELPLRRARVRRRLPAGNALVGRARELALLTDRLGTGGTLVCVGPAGVGKSALLDGLAVAARARGVPAVVRNAASATPCGLLLPLFAESGDPRGLEALRAAHLPAAAQAVARSVLSLAGGSPCLLALDDLDQCDGASLAILQRALPLLARSGCLVVAAGATAPLPGAEVLEVEPLEPESAALLLARLRPALAADPGRLAALARHGAGLPRQLEELVSDQTERALARIDALAPPAPTWLTALALLGDAPADTVGATAGVDAPTQARILAVAREAGLVRGGPDRLALADPAVGAALAARLVVADRRRLHQRAAAALAGLGRADEALQHEVQGDDAAQACIAAAALAARRLAEGRGAPALALARAGLERVAEARLEPAFATRLHILEARALRRLGKGAEAREVLVHAATLPGGSQVEPLAELASVERERGAFRRAAALLALAREAAGEAAPLLARVCWGEALLALARRDAEAAETACAALEALAADPPMRARCRVIRGRLEFLAGRPAAALVHLAAAASPLTHDVAERLEITCRMAEARAALGHEPEALATLAQVLQVAERQQELRLVAEARRVRGSLLLHAGEEATAGEEARAAAEAALSTGDCAGVAAACNLLADALHLQGKVREAESFRRHAGELAGRLR